jgi:hypothetical protein
VRHGTVENFNIVINLVRHGTGENPSIVLAIVRHGTGDDLNIVLAIVRHGTGENPKILHFTSQCAVIFNRTKMTQNLFNVSSNVLFPVFNFNLDPKC